MTYYLNFLMVGLVAFVGAVANAQIEQAQRLDSKDYYRVFCEVESMGINGQRHFSGWVSPSDAVYGPHRFRNHPEFRDNENVVRMTMEITAWIGNYGNIVQPSGADWRGNYYPPTRAATYEKQTVSCVSSISYFEEIVATTKPFAKVRVCSDKYWDRLKRVYNKDTGCEVTFR
jgi:hypothetical protein